jgi:hypothetical protein
MAFTVFADESGTDAAHQCYGIGALSIPNQKLDGFLDFLKQMVAAHGVVGEVKWKKVNNSHGQVNFGIDLLKRVLADGVRYDAIIVTKARYHKWQTEPAEEAFYTTYTQLVKHVARKTPDSEYLVLLDDRQDAYDKNEEVVQKIANYMLANAGSVSRIKLATKVGSKQYLGVQAADLITGAITAAHNRRLDPSAHLNTAKRILIDRMARVLGWDDLCYDTMPDSLFNVWSFPTECRCQFGPSRAVKLDSGVVFIKPEDLDHQ